jgi:hypothetical protein
MLSLPHDIQSLIWKKYYNNSVLSEMNQCSISFFLINTSKTRRENDMIMMRYNTEW